MIEYNDFKVGMKVKILGCPHLWSSELNTNCPFSIKDYPYYCIIKRISKGLNSVAMTDDKYGWSLSALVNCDLIEIISITEERKTKLLKLEKS